MDKEHLLDMYRKMVEIRRFDGVCVDLTHQDIMWAGFHSYEGQEAVAVGVLSHLSPDDYVLSSHRPQGHALAIRSDPGKVLAEMIGRRGGVGEGRGGPMTFSDWENHFIATATVGSGVPVATGIGLALQNRKKNGVVVSIFGDGAANTGACHEGINLGGVWKLPVLFVCENNLYGEALPFSKSTAAEHISDRAKGYGIEGVVVDGNDILAVFELAGRLIEKARSGGGPSLLETITYRTRGHYEGDPENYRTRQEIDGWRKKCPIVLFRKYLLEKSSCTEEELFSIEEEAEHIIQKAKEWALEQPIPTVDEMIDDERITAR